MPGIDAVSPETFALLILLTATAFTFFWCLDSITHGRLVKIDITDKELQTHRAILLTSVLMEATLVMMYWVDIIILPFFLAFFFTRTVHEFIDELHWHTDRCTPYESMLHLVMWVSILSNTFLMFSWGFFTHYRGLNELHTGYIIWAIILGIFIFFIGIKEWGRGSDLDHVKPGDK